MYPTFCSIQQEKPAFLCPFCPKTAAPAQPRICKKRPGPSHGPGLTGGRGWIRTTEALSSRFTVCPHWPLGNTPSFCLADQLVLPDDLFILPQALRFVNSFFEIFQARPMRCPVLSGCLCPCGAAGCAGLLAYSSTRREICQQPILLLL